MVRLVPAAPQALLEVLEKAAHLVHPVPLEKVEVLVQVDPRGLLGQAVQLVRQELQAPVALLVHQVQVEPLGHLEKVAHPVHLVLAEVMALLVQVE